jgi:hypothetical protein
MIAGPFVGTVRFASDSASISTGDGGSLLRRQSGAVYRTRGIAVYRTRGQYATGTAARAQLGKNPAGGTMVDVFGMSPCYREHLRNLLVARVPQAKRLLAKFE